MQTAGAGAGAGVAPTRGVAPSLTLKPAQPRLMAPVHAAADRAVCPVLSALQPLPEPHMGAVEDFLTARRDLDEHRRRTWGGKELVAGRYIGLIPSAFVASADIVKEVLGLEAAGAVRPGWPTSARALLGEESTLVTSDPVKHKLLRKLMAPALSADAVEGYLPDIHQICTNTLEQWVEESAAGKTAYAMPGVKAMTLKVISRVVLDMPLNEEEVHQMSQDFNIWLKQFFSVAPYDVWPLPFHASMRARDRLVARIEKRLTALEHEASATSTASATAHAHSPSRRSALSLLVNEQDEHGNKLSHKQVVDNLLTLLFAGHDTTASQLAILLYELAKHPQVMARVRAEQQQVVARHGLKMTAAALKDMKYTQAVLQEVFRTRPVVSATPRIATRDLALRGHAVKQGQGVVVSIGILMEHDPRWPEEGDPAINPLHPANFNPDRFLTPEGAKQGQQFPFWSGIRTCAGMALAQAEAKIFLATLARGYTYTADISGPWKRDPMPRPKDNLPVFVERLRDMPAVATA